MSCYDVLQSPDGRCEAFKIGGVYTQDAWEQIYRFMEKGQRYNFFMAQFLAVALIFVLFSGTVWLINQDPRLYSFAGYVETSIVAFLVLAGFVMIFWIGPSIRSRIKRELLRNGWVVLAERVQARNSDQAIWTANPDLVAEERQVKAGLGLIDQGKFDEASLVFERLIRERSNDAVILRFSKTQLEKIQSLSNQN